MNLPNSPGENQKLSRWKRFFFNQKYRFDLGYEFMVLLNFTLLLIAASDKLRYYTGLPRTWMLVAIAVPAGFLAIWLFGVFLDCVVHYAQAYRLEEAQRNPLHGAQQQQLDRIEKDLASIREKLG
jgi:hypothetical protein